MAPVSSSSSLRHATRRPDTDTKTTETMSSSQTKSDHVSDPMLRPFLDSSFEPAQYLNSKLPALQTSTSAGTASLADLSAETQTVLSQLSAHTTRLTSTLTQLTDEILRSGSRLAYEVDLLRGDTLGLAETLSSGLEEDVKVFVPNGLESHLKRDQRRASEGPGAMRKRSSTIMTMNPPSLTSAPANDHGETSTVANEPPHITQLRTLSEVRQRLESVIKTFGEAMDWTFPPSEISVGSSFLSISAPEPEGGVHTTEERGQQIAAQLRTEISDLLMSEDPNSGIEAATKRVDHLRDLTTLWKGTAEEKARARFVDGLAKLVEERQHDLVKDVDKPVGRRDAAIPTIVESSSNETRGLGGYGFINQLHKLRSGIS